MSSSRAPAILLSPLKRPYSLSLSPALTAISRRRTLCCFEPVKYCTAAPKLSGGTTRTSTCTGVVSVWMIAEPLVSPAARTRSTNGARTKCWMIRSDASSGADWAASVVTRISTSPMVSARRRSEPAGWILSMPLIRRRWAMTCSAAPSAWSRRMRPDDFSMNSIPRAIAAAFFSPNPGSAATKPSARTSFSSPMLETLRLS